ncbi:hypothetical protein BBBGCB_BBBGCB_12025, partial [Dysosmobacter welbionis]
VPAAPPCSAFLCSRAAVPLPGPSPHRRRTAPPDGWPPAPCPARGGCACFSNNSELSAAAPAGAGASNPPGCRTVPPAGY